MLKGRPPKGFINWVQVPHDSWYPQEVGYLIRRFTPRNKKWYSTSLADINLDRCNNVNWIRISLKIDTPINYQYIVCGDAVGRINCGQRNRSINLTDLFDRITLTPIFNGRFISTVPRYRSPYPGRNDTIVSKTAPLYSILVRFGFYRVNKC